MNYYEEQIINLMESIKYNIELKNKIKKGNYPSKDAQILACNRNIQRYERLLKFYEEQLNHINIK